MFLQEPAESPYDIRFALFGFPIRIAWTFWIGAVLFGYNLALSFDRLGGAASPGLFPLLFLWAACLMVSITIHELGHAFAFRYYGIESSIVLYHFGGLAIPQAGGGDFNFSSSRASRPLDEKGDLFIALAGPVAQMISAFVLVAIVVGSGFEVVAFDSMPWPISNLSQFAIGERIESIGLMAGVFFYVMPSVLWALLNLVPVFPLDGGRVMKSLVLLSGDRSNTWVWISLFSAGGVALYALTHDQPFLGLMFLSLAAGNYQMLQRPY